MECTVGRTQSYWTAKNHPFLIRGRAFRYASRTSCTLQHTYLMLVLKSEEVYPLHLCICHNTLHHSSSLIQQSCTFVSVCRWQQSMWSLTLFSLAAFLQLGKDVQCSAHRFKGSQLHMPTILSYGIQLTAEASYGALSHDRRLLQPGQAPSLGSPQSTVQSLAQACPTVDTTAASFICEPKEITLLAGQAVLLPQTSLALIHSQPCADLECAACHQLPVPPVTMPKH